MAMTRVVPGGALEVVPRASGRAPQGVCRGGSKMKGGAVEPVLLMLMPIAPMSSSRAWVVTGVGPESGLKFGPVLKELFVLDWSCGLTARPENSVALAAAASSGDEKVTVMWSAPVRAVVTRAEKTKV